MDLEREIRRKTAHLTALREIGRAINAASELAQTLELITRKTAEVVGMDSCSIYLYDEAGEYLILNATTGLAPESVGRARLRRGEGLTGWAALTGEAVGVADAARDPRFKYLAETKEAIFQSLLAAPLIHQGRSIGAINVQTRAYHEYGADEFELLGLIADMAAGALEKAKLYDQMQRRLSELSTLAEVSEKAISPLYLDDTLGLIVEMAARVMRAKFFSVMLYDEESGDLILKGAQSIVGPAYRNKPPLKLGEGVAGRVAQNGQPMAIEDVRTDPLYRYTDIARQEGLVSLLCVPLKVRDKVVGVFNCYTGEPHRYSAEEIALLSTLANQTALAIENARLVTNAAVVREMHHRIKNNLQSVAMLLRMQMRAAEQVNPRDVLQEAINRIQSIAAVHEMLSERGFRMVDIRDLLERVARGVAHSMARPGLNMQLSVGGTSFAMPSQPATSLALVVNELVQNAVEHAFEGRREGHIWITLAQEPAHWVIIVRDDGTGLAEGPGKHMGLKIVETLTREDLRGEFSLKSDAGTTATLRIPRS